MYSRRELTRLGLHKAVLRQRIGHSREQWAEAAAAAARPVAWLDRVVALWRRFSPVAKSVAGPLALAFGGYVVRRGRPLGSLLKWGSLALGVLRSFRGMRG